jgi:hypothetical protein
MKASLSDGLASMGGAAVPHAIAAKYAQPDRPVIALVGDGGLRMNIATCALEMFKGQKRKIEQSQGSSFSFMKLSLAIT